MKSILNLMISLALTSYIWFFTPCCYAQAQDTSAKSVASAIGKRHSSAKFNPFSDMALGKDIVAQAAGNDSLPGWKIPCTDALWKKLVASASGSKILESPKKALVIKKNMKEIKDFTARGGHWMGIIINDQPGPPGPFRGSIEIPPRSTTQIRHFIGHMAVFYIINNSDNPAPVTFDESDRDITIDVDNGKVLVICDLTNLDKNRNRGIYRIALFKR